MNMEKKQDQEKDKEKEKELTQEWNDDKQTQKGTFHIDHTRLLHTINTISEKTILLYEVVFWIMESEVFSCGTPTVSLLILLISASPNFWARPGMSFVSSRIKWSPK